MQATETHLDGNLILIRGTEGNFDYALIDKRDGFALGIKPLIQISEDTTSFAFRVRAVPFIEETDNVTAPVFGDDDAIVQKMVATYSGLSFSKIDPSRASTMGTLGVQIGKYQAEKLLAWVKAEDIANKILNAVSEAAGIEEVKNKEEVLSFLNRVYIGEPSKILTKSEAIPETATPTVIKFPGPELDLADLEAEAENLKGGGEDPDPLGS